MNSDKQRIAIAESVGWKDCHENENWAATIGTLYEVNGNQYAVLPDYLNDLNAMHDAMAYLEPEQVDLFAVELSDIVLENPHKAWWDLEPNEVGHVANASAKQRAEAYLKIIKKWKE